VEDGKDCFVAALLAMTSILIGYADELKPIYRKYVVIARSPAFAHRCFSEGEWRDDEAIHYPCVQTI
jgi:hypothetical protein